MGHYYIYSVIANRSLPNGLKGLDGKPVDLLCVGDLAAVVSPTQRENFDDIAEEAMLALVGSHDGVNLKLLEHGLDLVPLRFGMVAPDLDEVRGKIASLSFQLKAALKRVANHVELSIQLSRDHDKEVEECSARDEKIIALRKKFAGAPSVELQMEVGKCLFEAVENRRKECINRVLSILSPLAAAVKLNGLSNRDMIMNGAFLIHRDREVDFDAAVNKAADQEGDEITFRYIGPMAAYSFSAVEFQITPSQVLAEARDTLELPERASMVDIRNAYRRLARKHHPDRSENGADAYQHYQDIVNAYDILIAYGENYMHSFAPEDVQCRDRSEAPRPEAVSGY